MQPADSFEAPAESDEDLLAALDPPWWKRPRVMVVGSLCLVILLVAVELLLYREPTAGAGPIPAALGPHPFPAPEKRRPDAGTPRDAQDRKNRAHPPPVRAGKVETYRIRQVPPRASRKLARLQGPPNYGELRIQVRVNGVPVDDAEVMVDGERVGTAPVRVPLKSGAHSVRILRPPFPVSRFSLDVPGQQSVQLEVELQPIDEPSTEEVFVTGELEVP